jgi:hypothetical protein
MSAKHQNFMVSNWHFPHTSFVSQPEANQDPNAGTLPPLNAMGRRAVNALPPTINSVSRVYHRSLIYSLERFRSRLKFDGLACHEQACQCQQQPIEWQCIRVRTKARNYVHVGVGQAAHVGSEQVYI